MIYITNRNRSVRKGKQLTEEDHYLLHQVAKQIPKSKNQTSKIATQIKFSTNTVKKYLEMKKYEKVHYRNPHINSQIQNIGLMAKTNFLSYSNKLNSEGWVWLLCKKQFTKFVTVYKTLWTPLFCVDLPLLWVLNKKKSINN